MSHAPLSMSVEPLQIRTATASDAPQVTRLLDGLGYPTAAADVPARLERLATSRGAVFLAWRGTSAVGLATVHVLSVLNRPADVAWLTALVVDEQARGGGVGRALVAHVEAYARAAGCEKLSVTTHEERDGARAFYVRVGLEPTGRRFGKMLGA